MLNFLKIIICLLAMIPLVSSAQPSIFDYENDNYETTKDENTEDKNTVKNDPTAKPQKPIDKYSQEKERDFDSPEEQESKK